MLLGIIFLKTELNKAHFLRDEMIFMHCTLQIQQNIHIRNFSCRCSGTIYSKSIKNGKKSNFWKFTISLLVNLFSNIGVSRASSNRIIYFYKKMSWHQIVNLSNHDRK